MPPKRKAYPLLHLLYRPNTADGKLVAELTEAGYTKTDIMRAGLQALRNRIGLQATREARYLAIAEAMTDLLGGEE